MNPWHDGRLTVLDLETTHSEPWLARIVVASVAYVSGGKATDQISLVADPGIEIPEEAAAIHGYTTKRVREIGRPAPDVLDIVLGMLERRPPGSPVVAFNAPYDLTVLDRECIRHEMAFLDTNRLRVVDPLVLDKHLHRYRPGSRRLVDQCHHYNARLEAPHVAAADAISTGRLAWRIAKSANVIRRVRGPEEAEELAELQAEWLRVRDDLDLLHEAQVRWYRQQAEGLRKYFKRQGRDGFVPIEWPIIYQEAEDGTQTGQLDLGVSGGTDPFR